MAAYSTVEERPPQHQVFINFRGIGLRRGFVSHLYRALTDKKINAFYDDKEDRGENLEKLLKRIEESRIAVAILSSKYNESDWCLRELAKMKECMDGGKLVIIPIFYKVSTSTVKDMRGQLDVAIKNLKGDDATTKKKEWEEALKWIPSLTGFRVKEDSDESKKLQKIVEEIYNWLKKIPSDGSQIASVETTENSNSPTSSSPQKDTTFGINQRLKELEEKLDLTDKKTRIIGVVGIGKTTLLKELFKKWQHKFTNCAFIDQIREKLKSSEDFHILPKLLVNKLLALTESILDNVEDPYEVYKVPLQECKVLVILDDVSKREQIDALLGKYDLGKKHDWIKEGSRIVIATNDMSLLKDRVQGDPYVVQKLNHQDSLNLFSYHAFDQDNPSEDFMELSKEFVHYAKGHPLALKILGRELRGKKKEIWDSQLMNLGQSPRPYIGSVVQVSYDELTPEQKEAFHGTETGRDGNCAHS